MENPSQYNTLSRTLRCSLQIISFILFILLILSAIWPTQGTLALPIPTGLFMALDPLWALLTPIMTQTWPPLLGFGLAVLILSLFFGRFFCGAICPLGTLLDMVRPKKTIPKKIERKLPHNLRFVILFFCISTAVFGSSVAFLLDPLAILTRAVSIPLYAGFSLLGDTALGFLQSQESLANILQDLGLTYATTNPRPQASPFSWSVFLLGLPISIIALEWYAPRFWCRVLCPTGALLSLAAWRPIWRRHVHIACNHCGECQRVCPVQAIATPRQADTAHCLVCQRCVAICPAKGAVFTTGTPSIHAVTTPTPHDLSKRLFLGTASLGILVGGLSHIATKAFAIPQPTPLRPPASLPENDFTAQCIRCGLCIKACPTGALQLAYPESGLASFMTPIVVPRLGMCEPSCHACADVCPTNAIRRIPSEERLLVRIGTARIDKQLCIAWAKQQRCMVCQEVCPYGAVLPQRNTDLSIDPTLQGADIPVPVVNIKRCTGCGYCEFHCPAKKHAISVYPDNALRLSGESYTKTTREQGLYRAPFENTNQASQGQGFYRAPLNTSQASPERAPTLAPLTGTSTTLPNFDLPKDNLPPGFTE